MLVPGSGQWDMDVFDPLLAQMTAWCGHVGVTFAGSLLCPHGSVLKEIIERRLPVNDMSGAAKEAGRQLIKECISSKELFNTISRPLRPKDRNMERLAQAGLPT